MPQQRMQDARRQLSGLQLLAYKTEQAERRILQAAEERLDAVQSEIGTLRPRALADADAAERYQALILERGKLQQVIARSRQHLSA